MTSNYYNFCNNRYPSQRNLCNKCLQCIYPKSPYQSCHLCGEINTSLFMIITLDKCRQMICSKCIYSQTSMILSCPTCENINTKKMYLYFCISICILIKLIPDIIWIILWSFGVYITKEIMYLLYY